LPVATISIFEHAAEIISSDCRRLTYWQGARQNGLDPETPSHQLPIGIEARLRYVTDEELMVVASLVGVALESLYPEES